MGYNIMKRAEVFFKDKLVCEADVANGFFSRLRGLMWKSPIERGLLLMPCSDIHTFCMKERIDVVFLSEEGKVLRFIEAMEKNKMSGMVKGAKNVLELPANTFLNSGANVGDELRFEWKGAKR